MLTYWQKSVKKWSLPKSSQHWIVFFEKRRCSYEWRQGLNRVARRAKGPGARGAEATLGAHANPLPQPLLPRTTGESPSAAPKNKKND